MADWRLKIFDIRIYYHYVETIDWSYQVWYRSPNRVVYKVMSGPLAGRINYAQAWYKEILPDLYQVSWLEETGTIVSQIVNLQDNTVTTFAAFSKGHFENPATCRGTKIDNLHQWRMLAQIGNQTERHMVNAKGVIDKIDTGPGEDLPVIEDDWPVL